MLLKFDKKPRIHIFVQENSPHNNAYFLNKYSLDNSKFMNQNGKLKLAIYFKNLKTNFIKSIVLNKLIIQTLFLNL